MSTESSTLDTVDDEPSQCCPHAGGLRKRKRLLTTGSFTLGTVPTCKELGYHESLPDAALKKFYDTAAQYRPSSGQLDQFIGHPLSDEEISVSIQEYNDDMNDNMSLWGCAVCGIREMDGKQRTIVLRDLSHLIVNSGHYSDHCQLPEVVQSYFSIVDVLFKERDPALHHGMFLHEQFLIPSCDVNEAAGRQWCDTDCASVCRVCFGKLTGKKITIPDYAIANGYDFGHPIRAGLKPLSLVERKLIARNIMFATIVKLVSPIGKNTQQRALQGHVITMPHQGAPRLAAILPNTKSVAEMMSVMFVGTAEQWQRQSGKSGDEQRGKFVQAHKSLFQVRCDVVFAWLHALTASGNPYYRDIELLANNVETSTQLKNLSDTIIDDAHVASSEKTAAIEQFTVSDVARVRPQTIEGSNDAAGITGILLQNNMLPPQRAAATVLQSLKNTLSEKLVSCSMISSVAGCSETMDLSSAQQSALSAEPLIVLSETKPLNEFTENDKIFLGSFPDLFFLGRMFPKNGSVSESFTRHLLRQADNRFAQADELIFALFNQSQRHAAARQVAARVKSDPKSVNDFASVVEAPGFLAKLQRCIESPESKEARSLLARLMPLIRIAGVSVPFGPIERSLAVSRVCAVLQYFGLPAWFVTISPSDLDSVLILRLAKPLEDNNDPCEHKFILPALNVRAQTLANNPVAAAEVFIRLVTAVFKCLIALPLHHFQKQAHCPVKERRQGIFGVPIAHYTAIEVQGA